MIAMAKVSDVFKEDLVIWAQTRPDEDVPMPRYQSALTDRSAMDQRRISGGQA